MAELYKPADVLGRRYSITIEPHRSDYSGDGFSATMTCRGRKTTWSGGGKTADEAKADILRYLDARLHPFVNVTVKGA
jgi:hypothetical protein